MGQVRIVFNGPEYKKNNYNVKMAVAYKRYSK